MGFCGQATKAKENTIVGQEKEQINLAWSAIDTKDLSGEEIEDELAEFQEELNHLAGEGKTEVTYNDETDCYEIKYKNSGKIYYLDWDYSGRVQITSKEEMLAKAIQIEVDSGEDGIVELPIWKYEGIVEWGDGTTSEATEVSSLENIKLASLENIKIAGLGLAEPYRHEYAEKNKKYTVKIYGGVSEIYSRVCNTREKILGILDWGETGLRYIWLQDCTNLKNIASPRSNSFKEIEDFDYAFKNCTSLTSIPQDLFNNCPNVTSFLGTFAGCTSLTGDPIPLWNRVEHGETNGWEGEPNGLGCYNDCVNLNNYDSIPQYWRREVIPM